MLKKKKLSIYCCIILFAFIFVQQTNFVGREESISIILGIGGNDNNNGYLDLNYVNYSDLADPFFTLRIMTNNDSQHRMNTTYIIQEQLEEIGIAIDVEHVDWLSFVTELISTRNFDMCIVALSGRGADPDFTGIYDENGSLNLFGYHTSMDWDAGLGTGINEWYMDQGTLIMPPDSEERKQHYWDWQDYLMDKICPTVTLATPYYYDASWSNLNGYNMTEGLLQSWGKMSWSGLHTGQISSSEVVTSDANWSQLNPLFPLFSDDSASTFIQRACMDPLIKFDADNNFYPHVITDWTHINDTWVRLSIREDIEWQDDPGAVFTNEYLDVKDVYFTLYCWKYHSEDQHLYDWLEDMVIIDDYTLDIFIDGDPSISGNQVYAPYLSNLVVNVLPEHYLNQTQEIDGVTPDITHASWATFSTSCFGTGLFEFDSYTPGDETILTVFSDCWLLNPFVDKSDMDFVNRFGTFSGGLNQLRIRNDLNATESYSAFESGSIDIVSVISLGDDQRALYEADSNYNVYSTLANSFLFSGFNMRESRGTPMQSMDPCPYNPSMTIGLAIRKAISYAINGSAINEEVYDGERFVHNYPIFPTSGKWLNPDIIKYTCNITKAKEMMFYAGYETGLDSDGDGLTDIEEAETYFTDRLDTDSDNDGLDDQEEVTSGIDGYLTDPNDADSDDDGLNDGDEYTESTDPNDTDSDNDGIPDGEEVILGTDGYETNPTNADTDGDGLDDYEETILGIDNYLTDPTDSDSDDDGLTDYQEYQIGSDPNDAEDPPEDVDHDDDGIFDAIEDDIGTDPDNPDTDGDGLTDGEEFYGYYDPLNPGANATGWIFTNPLLNDTDTDGLSDYFELVTSNTNPNNADTENDGMDDGWEVFYGLNPNVNDASDDFDNDGMSNLAEYHSCTDPKESDTDGDGADDGVEIGKGTDPCDPADKPFEWESWMSIASSAGGALVAFVTVLATLTKRRAGKRKDADFR